MKTSSFAVKATSLTLLAMTALSGAALANSSADQYARDFKNGEREKWVFVTGSLIPQKIKVKSIGTATTSNLRVIKRGEIDASGRFTTRDVLAQESSLRVVGGSSLGVGR